MSCDKTGRPYAKKDEVVEGTLVEVDGDFSCMIKGSIKTVMRDSDGHLCVECDEGTHLIDPQLNDQGYYVGIYLVNN